MARKMKVCVLVGGPTSATRFRPLSFDVPKPLVPVAGLPLIAHHMNAISQLKEEGLLEVILLGFFEEGVFKDFCADATAKLGVPVKYMKEPKHLGTAGGLAYFHNEINAGMSDSEDSKDVLIILHGDVLCPFPLKEMLEFYSKKEKAGGCVMGHRVSHEDVHHYGCLVYDKDTNEIVHYVEKPETEAVFSNTVNGGVYLFSVFSLYSHLAEIRTSLVKEMDVRASPGRINDSLSGSVGDGPVRIRMEHDLLPLMADDHLLYVYHFEDWWVPIKAPFQALECSKHLMATPPPSPLPYSVVYTSKKERENVLGNNYIHPSAQVHPTALIGPNVAISANCKVGAGARVAHSILLPGTVLNDRCCVRYSILSVENTVGKWARVDGQPTGKEGEGITVTGKGVEIKPEIIVRSTIILPHKSVGESSEGRIIL
uniref:Nucleotidyl transferase domain-containing protein n=1 Tax=Paramoeba aestuarina TaxID=180227 RepID=A0A7S4PCC1_9EUKA|mmetsp:Transcript_40264/g.63711  ORF Transcript_40264/g.63711 Transcript_40264/m.63711 type:complete len:427 (+) Transcript_40264:30-1310(+)